MAFYTKHFTIEKARRELPELKRQFARVQEIVERLRKAKVETNAINKLVSSNGSGSKHPSYGAEVSELQAITAAITERGIEIKDVARGLVDFPSMRNGEEVYLCWLYGEDDLEYWHTLEGGFAARRPLD